MRGEAITSIHQVVILPTVMQRNVEAARDNIVDMMMVHNRRAQNKIAKVSNIMSTLFQFSDDETTQTHINENVIEHLTRRFTSAFKEAFKTKELSIYAEDFRSNMKVTLAHLLQK